MLGYNLEDGGGMEGKQAGGTKFQSRIFLVHITWNIIQSLVSQMLLCILSCQLYEDNDVDMIHTGHPSCNFTRQSMMLIHIISGSDMY